VVTWFLGQLVLKLEMPFRIPVIGRLGLLEYQSLVLALIFFFFEALIRLIVMFIPQFVLRFLDKVIYVYV
jgi:lysosomal acid lipase/cholesteryl ester hydrolase